MNLETATRIRDSLLDVQETVSDWDDQLFQNPNFRETCHDIYESCRTVMDVIDHSLSVSEEGDQNDSASGLEVGQQFHDSNS